MSLWTCGPACDVLVLDCTDEQAAQLRKSAREHDYVIACAIVHPGKELE